MKPHWHLRDIVDTLRDQLEAAVAPAPEIEAEAPASAAAAAAEEDDDAEDELPIKELPGIKTNRSSRQRPARASSAAAQAADPSWVAAPSSRPDTPDNYRSYSSSWAGREPPAKGGRVKFLVNKQWMHGEIIRCGKGTVDVSLASGGVRKGVRNTDRKLVFEKRVVKYQSSSAKKNARLSGSRQSMSSRQTPTGTWASGGRRGRASSAHEQPVPASGSDPYAFHTGLTQPAPPEPKSTDEEDADDDGDEQDGEECEPEKEALPHEEPQAGSQQGEGSGDGMEEGDAVDNQEEERQEQGGQEEEPAQQSRAQDEKLEQKQEEEEALAAEHEEEGGQPEQQHQEQEAAAVAIEEEEKQEEDAAAEEDQDQPESPEQEEEGPGAEVQMQEQAEQDEASQAQTAQAEDPMAVDAGQEEHLPAAEELGHVAEESQLQQGPRHPEDVEAEGGEQNEQARPEQEQARHDVPSMEDAETLPFDLGGPETHLLNAPADSHGASSPRSSPSSNAAAAPQEAGAEPGAAPSVDSEAPGSGSGSAGAAVTFGAVHVANVPETAETTDSAHDDSGAQSLPMVGAETQAELEDYLDQQSCPMDDGDAAEAAKAIHLQHVINRAQKKNAKHLKKLGIKDTGAKQERKRANEPLPDEEDERAGKQRRVETEESEQCASEDIFAPSRGQQQPRSNDEAESAVSQDLMRNSQQMLPPPGAAAAAPDAASGEGSGEGSGSATLYIGETPARPEDGEDEHVESSLPPGGTTPGVAPFEVIKETPSSDDEDDETGKSAQHEQDQSSQHSSAETQPLTCQLEGDDGDEAAAAGSASGQDEDEEPGLNATEPLSCPSGSQSDAMGEVEATPSAPFSRQPEGNRVSEHVSPSQLPQSESQSQSQSQTNETPASLLVKETPPEADRTAQVRYPLRLQLLALLLTKPCVVVSQLAAPDLQPPDASGAPPRTAAQPAAARKSPAVSTVQRPFAGSDTQTAKKGSGGRLSTGGSPLRSLPLMSPADDAGAERPAAASATVGFAMSSSAAAASSNAQAKGVECDMFQWGGNTGRTVIVSKASSDGGRARLHADGDAAELHASDAPQPHVAARPKPKPVVLRSINTGRARGSDRGRGRARGRGRGGTFAAPRRVAPRANRAGHAVSGNDTQTGAAGRDSVDGVLVPDSQPSQSQESHGFVKKRSRPAEQEEQVPLAPPVGRTTGSTQRRRLDGEGGAALPVRATGSSMPGGAHGAARLHRGIRAATPRELLGTPPPTPDIDRPVVATHRAAQSEHSEHSQHSEQTEHTPAEHTEYTDREMASASVSQRYGHSDASYPADATGDAMDEDSELAQVHDTAAGDAGSMSTRRKVGASARCVPSAASLS